MHKKKDLISIVRYCEVQTVKNNELTVYDVDDNSTFQIFGSALIDSLASADNFTETQEKTQTQLAEILSTSYNRPMTICFIKKDATERILRGRLASPEPLLGRSWVEDLDISNKKDRLRLVDHRTIRWIVVGGVKYIHK